MNKTLKGKTVVNFGDSIFGNFRAPEDISSFIAEETGADVYNVGFGGCRMSEHSLKHFDRFCMYRIADAITTRNFTLQEESFSYPVTGEALPIYFKDSLKTLESIDFSKVDIATVAYGTNDFTAAQKLEGENKYDLTSFAGSLRYSIEKISEAYPNIKLVICSQTYRFWRDKEGNFIDDSNMRVINGNMLPDFVKKTEEIAGEYKLDYINNYTGSGISYETRDKCFSATDGTHPIVYGRRLIAENISRYLLKHFG